MKIRGNPTLDPGPFFFEGGPVGCLLIHGFTGAPTEVRPVGEYLHRKGLTVSGPLLAGHGTSPEELNRVRWQDWVASAEKALLALRARCEVVFVGGLSMGALVTMHLAARYPDLAGIILYSPAWKVAQRFMFLLPLARYVVKQWPKEPEGETDLTDPEAPLRLWHYDTNPTHGAYELMKLQRVVRREARRIRVPAIIFYSTRDSAIHPTSAQRTFAALGSRDKELVTLHNSGHCLTVDSERETVWARTFGFMVARAGGKL